jgi:hypothetical protein
LLALLPEDEQIPLTLRDGTRYEEILVSAESDLLFINERGVDGTEAHKFPCGTRVTYEVTRTVVKDYVCHYDCCVNDPCPAEPVNCEAVLLPEGYVGIPWQGSAIFSGSGPMVLAAEGLPTWMAAEVGANYIQLHGTPTEAGNVSLTVVGVNAAKTLSITTRTFQVLEAV